jgi:hypothetical protein
MRVRTASFFRGSPLRNAQRVFSPLFLEALFCLFEERIVFAMEEGDAVKFSDFSQDLHQVATGKGIGFMQCTCEPFEAQGTRLP